jgi:hypothetical protein
MTELIRDSLKADLSIPRDSKVKPTDHCADALRKAVFARQLVYTVFDGDQELMCGLMRHAIMRKGLTPVNPPSVLGYRDTVLRNKTKSRVLLEDVALLNKCDQIWIFADVDHLRNSKSPIPEGALFELLFAKLFRPGIPVFTVRPQDLFADDVVPRQFSLDNLEELSDPQSIEEITNDLQASLEHMPKVRYYYYDPLDFKYGEWVRGNNKATGIAPVDPMLSIRLRDGHQDLGDIGQAWLALLRLADELCYVSSLHEQEGASVWCHLLESAYRTCFVLPKSEISWAELGVPKALLGSKWPVTSREADIVLSKKRPVRLCA